MQEIIWLGAHVALKSYLPFSIDGTFPNAQAANSIGAKAPPCYQSYMFKAKQDAVSMFTETEFQV